MKINSAKKPIKITKVKTITTNNQRLTIPTNNNQNVKKKLDI